MSRRMHAQLSANVAPDNDDRILDLAERLRNGFEPPPSQRCHGCGHRLPAHAQQRGVHVSCHQRAVQLLMLTTTEAKEPS